jgi:hypothetical protein
MRRLERTFWRWCRFNDRFTDRFGDNHVESSGWKRAFYRRDRERLRRNFQPVAEEEGA